MPPVYQRHLAGRTTGLLGSGSIPTVRLPHHWGPPTATAFTIPKTNRRGFSENNYWHLRCEQNNWLFRHLPSGARRSGIRAQQILQWRIAAQGESIRWQSSRSKCYRYFPNAPGSHERRCKTWNKGRRPRSVQFRQFDLHQKLEQSKELNDLKEPCIIISASGMAKAGQLSTTLPTTYPIHAQYNHDGGLLLSRSLTHSGTGLKKFPFWRNARSESPHYPKWKHSPDTATTWKWKVFSIVRTNSGKKTFLVHGEYEGSSNFTKEFWRKTVLKIYRNSGLLKWIWTE